jgi:hypothetical protein
MLTFLAVCLVRAIVDGLDEWIDEKVVEWLLVDGVEVDVVCG